MSPRAHLKNTQPHGAFQCHAAEIFGHRFTIPIRRPRQPWFMCLSSLALNLKRDMLLTLTFPIRRPRQPWFQQIPRYYLGASGREQDRPLRVRRLRGFPGQGFQLHHGNHLICPYCQPACLFFLATGRANLLQICARFIQVSIRERRSVLHQNLEKNLAPETHPDRRPRQPQ